MEKYLIRYTEVEGINIVDDIVKDTQRHKDSMLDSYKKTGNELLNVNNKNIWKSVTTTKKLVIDSNDLINKGIKQKPYKLIKELLNYDKELLNYEIEELNSEEIQNLLIKPQEINLKIEKAKKEKLKLLKDDFNKSKKVTITNGKTLTIPHDCPDRKIFFEILEEVKKLDNNMELSHIFVQKSSDLGFRVSPYIAHYILLNAFTFNTGGRIVSIRAHNKAIIYNNAENKIKKAKTFEEVQSVTWEFVKKDGIVIDINKRVEDIMNGDDYRLQEAVKLVTDEDNKLHFIKTGDELEKA